MLTFIRFCNLWNEILHCCSPVHILCYMSRSQSGSQWLMQTRNCPSQEYLSTLYFLLWEPTLNSGKSFSYLFSAAKFHIIFRKEERGHDVKWAILNALNKFKPKNSCDLKKIHLSTCVVFCIVQTIRWYISVILHLPGKNTYMPFSNLRYIFLHYFNPLPT